jgi:type IV pilus assembly protein PilM
MGLPMLNRQAKKRDQIVAIDLGGRTTKAVHLQRRGERFALANYALLDAPISEKNISTDLLADHLKSVSRALNCSRARQVTLALGVADTLFRQVELPAMPVSDMRQMLKFNSKTYLQQELPDHVFDCSVLATPQLVSPPAGGKPASGIQKQRVAVGGARKQVVDDLQAAVRTAGLVPDVFVPGVIGPINAFELAEPESFTKEVVALVDVGFKNSTITILDAGEIVLNRVVALGGDRLTGGLAEMLGISYVEAENIKLGMPAEVQANLEPLLHPLSRELRASIDFFENQRDKTVTQAFVSGGSAQSEFIIQALQTELMVPCRVWNPTRSLEMALPPEKLGEVEQVASQLTVAVGAAAAAF